MKTPNDIHETLFHGKNKQGAIDRAKLMNGECVYSMAPGESASAPGDKWGYWSGPTTMLRTYETRIYPTE